MDSNHKKEAALQKKTASSKMENWISELRTLSACMLPSISSCSFLQVHCPYGMGTTMAADALFLLDFPCLGKADSHVPHRMAMIWAWIYTLK